MASKPGRKTNSWKTYSGRYCRCLATHLYRDGHNQKELVARFKKHIPNYQRFFPNPLSDQAIWMRGYLGSKPGYEREHPDRDPASARAWAETREIIDENMAFDPIRLGE